MTERRNGALEVERRDAGQAYGNSFRVRTQLELRAKEGAKMPGLRGYTAVFDSWSEALGIFEDFREKIAPGTFAKTITESDIRGLFNHETNLVLGRTRPDRDSNTLRVAEDSTGLEFEVEELPDSTIGRDVATMVERGDVDGCSFGFRTVADEWHYERPDDAPSVEDDERDGVTIEAWRTLTEVRLYDVGPVTYPAYPETTAEVRSKLAELKTGREQRAAESNGRPGYWLRSYAHRLRELEALGGVPLDK